MKENITIMSWPSDIFLLIFPLTDPQKEDTTEVELLRAIAVHSFCRFPSHGVNQTTKEMGMRRSFVFPLFFFKEAFCYN